MTLAGSPSRECACAPVILRRAVSASIFWSVCFCTLSRTLLKSMATLMGPSHRSTLGKADATCSWPLNIAVNCCALFNIESQSADGSSWLASTAAMIFGRWVQLMGVTNITGQVLWRNRCQSLGVRINPRVELAMDLIIRSASICSAMARITGQSRVCQTTEQDMLTVLGASACHAAIISKTSSSASRKTALLSASRVSTSCRVKSAKVSCTTRTTCSAASRLTAMRAALARVISPSSVL